MDIAAVLDAYDRQLRRSVTSPTPEWIVERTERLIRLTAPPGASWGDGVVCSDLDAETADAAIAATITYFNRLGRAFEWKHHGYDTPADLTDRLVRAGFVADPTETVMVGEIGEVRDRLEATPAPAGITLRHLRGPEDWDAIRALHEAVWEDDASGLVREVAAEKAADPASMQVHIAEAADGRLVSAAWVRFASGTDFASLWGGSTLAQFRRRGIYRALVARRTAEAAERGFRYLQVDASDDSRPILERLGLQRLTTTTPYQWSP